eukprot:866415_1
MYQQPQQVYAAGPQVVVQQQAAAQPPAMLKKYRPAFSRRYAQFLEITHDADNMERKCCGNQAVHDGTYTWVMENRLEWNRPFKACCGIQDNITVIYYDDFDSAHDATPCCATCRGIGEVVRLKRTCCCCCKCAVTEVGYLKDAKRMIVAIDDARKHLKDMAIDF